MEDNKSLLVGIIVVVVIIAGGILFFRQNSLSKLFTSKPTPTPSATTITGQQTISLSSDGFSPSTLVVKVGTHVRWINNSNANGDIESDAMSYPPMNFGSFSPGSFVELVFDQPGTYHYHNQVKPSQKGTIIVQR